MAPTTPSRSPIPAISISAPATSRWRLWVKPDGSNANKDLFHWSNSSGGDDFSLRLITNNHLMVDLTLDGGTTSHIIADAGQIAADSWHHLALVRTDKVLRVYIDGAVTAYASMYAGPEPDRSRHVTRGSARTGGPT